MKRILIFMLILCIMGCHQKNNNPSITDQSTNNNTVHTKDLKKLNQKIKINIDEQEIIISLYDNNLSQQLIKALPLDCEFIEYGNCEKAANINHLIKVENTPLGYEPKPGDVVVYEPWGNFTIFFDEFRYSESLALIGTVDSGLEILSQIDGNFSGHVELIE